MRTPRTALSTAAAIGGDRLSVEAAIAAMPPTSLAPLMKSLVDKLIRGERDRRVAAVGCKEALAQLGAAALRECDKARMTPRAWYNAQKGMLIRAGRRGQAGNPFTVYFQREEEQSDLLKRIAALPGGLALVAQWTITLSCATDEIPTQGETFRDGRLVVGSAPQVHRALDAIGVTHDYISVAAAGDRGWTIGLKVDHPTALRLLPELHTRLHEQLVSEKIELAAHQHDLFVRLSDEEVGVADPDVNDPDLSDEAPVPAAPN